MKIGLIGRCPVAAFGLPWRTLGLLLGLLAATPIAAQSVCQEGFPVDCGAYCCESGSVCSDGGCQGLDGDWSCPDDYPVDCGTFCCPFGDSCGSDSTCLTDSETSEPPDEACPADHPVDCGNGYCCPWGTTCVADVCVDSGGAPDGDPDESCSPEAITTHSGICTIDACVANAESAYCESYYIVDGERIWCSGCEPDSSCLSAAIEACPGEGVSTGLDSGLPPDYSVPSIDDSVAPTYQVDEDCCQANNACDWADDGMCDCNGAYADSWDRDDCEGRDTPVVCSAGHAGAERRGAGFTLLVAAVGALLFWRKRG